MKTETKKFILLMFFCAALSLANVVNAFSQKEDVNSKDETGLTPLMLAAQDGTAAELKKLLNKGADLEIKDQFGWTALMYASAAFLAEFPSTTPNASALKALLDANADVNVSDPRGNTPLMIAAFEDKPEFVKLLLAKGANVNAVNKKGATALSYARAGRNEKIVKLLEKAGGTGIVLDRANVPQRIAPIDLLPKTLNLSQSRARYTDEARQNGITGTVRLRILVAADGKIKKWKVISGLPYGLTEAVVKATLILKFAPAMHDGQPVEYWLPKSYTFSIN